jgi:uncharacterized protein involved in cysteine biosynthesis
LYGYLYSKPKSKKERHYIDLISTATLIEVKRVWHNLLFISDKKELRQKRKKSTIIAMLASLFNYIPILNIFAPIFAQIFFLHHILKETE